MASPTVALNTPSDASTVSALTPELKFTGTDADGDAISYEVQVDTGTGFNTITDSYSEANSNATNFLYDIGGNEIRTAGQSFTGDGNTINTASLYLSKSGSPTGSMYCYIYAHSGTYGTSSVPTGSPLATSDALNISTLTGSLAMTNFHFSTPFSTVSGTKYCLIWTVFGGSSSSICVNYGRDISSPTHSGNLIYYTRFDSSWNPVSGNDSIFSVSYIPLIDALSATDPGFADITNGAHTDPFVSGDQIGYTVQAALTDNTTYYWRVRGKDPLGSNTFGAWATTQSFTVTTFTSPFPSFFRT